VEFAPADSPVGKHGALSISGRFVIDEFNNPVQLTGMSLFWSQWMGQYYHPRTISWLRKDWQCSVVRAAMGVEHGGYLENPQREKEKVFKVIEAAIEEGMYVVVDWHDHHGEDHVNEARAFFAEVAQKYGHRPNIIYELYNEPLNVSWSKVIKPYCELVIDTIRAHDPDNIIACGTPNWSQRVDEASLDPIQRDNIVYVLHFYAATHKAELRNVAQTAIDRGLPLMVTEFGTTEATGNGKVDEEETRLWLDFMKRNKISWCNWSVADKNESSAALKPGTSVSDWTEAKLTKSAMIIRKEIRNSASR
jgi:endoglucanase